eukprot:TRINITY_DN4020_c0_g1_i2.p1 TRINITY_DN4020_c0_g1~~TRINITY_DN4020_c0_g1_i2.p1  ORF type:complete len:2409 (-),score=332.13 TRINITY_DN4020_c0_g1_i2:1267-8115(-)
MAVRCLGRFARIYHGAMARELIASQISNSLEALKQTDQFRRQAAVITLAELIHGVPALISIQQVEKFIDVIWNPLNDSSLGLREGTVEALKWSLRFLKKRTDIRRIHDKLYETARDHVIKNKSTDLVHGSILVLTEILGNSDTDTHNDTRLEEITNLLFSLKEHKNSLVRRTVIHSVPQLAHFNPELFSSKYLNISSSYLIQMMKKERTVAVGALGQLAMELHDRMYPVIDAVFNSIIKCIEKEKQGTQIVIPTEFFRCFALLARALGPKVENQMQCVMEYLFATDFVQILVDTLSDIAAYIPSLRKNIQKQLLSSITKILRISNSHTTVSKTLEDFDELVPNGFFSFKNHTDGMAGNNSTNNNTYFNTEHHETLILLSLQTLSSFDFDSSETRPLVPAVVPYLVYDNLNIRKYAAFACTKMLADKGKPIPIKGYASEIIIYTLSRLFYVAMTDPDPTIRLAILQCLDERFDLYLLQSDSLKTLFLFVKDSVFEIQEVAIKILGRLSEKNPAYIHPILRTNFIDYLRTVEIPESSHNLKEQSIRLFALLTRSVPRLVRPYTEYAIQTILKILSDQKHAGEENTSFSCYSLAALGDVASVTGDELMVYVDNLLPVIMENFYDQNSSQKRMVALHALGELIQSTGYAVDPLVPHPKLLDTLLHKIKRANSTYTLNELMRLLGIIGAVDPYRQRTLQLELLEKDQETGNENDRIQSSPFWKEFMRGLTPQSEDYYSTITLEILMRFMSNPYGNLQNLVVQAVMSIFKHMGLRCVPYLKHFMPIFVEVINVCGNTTPGLREQMFQQLAILTSLIKHFTRDYLSDLVELMERYWSNDSLIEYILELLQQICIVLGDESKSCIQKFLPKLLKVLNSKEKQSIKVLLSLRIFGSNLDQYIALIIPSVTALFAYESSKSVEVSNSAITFIGHLSYTHDLSPYVLGIFHAINTVLESNTLELYKPCLNTVVDLCTTLGNPAFLFLGKIRAIVSKRLIVHPKFEDFLLKLRNKEQLVPEMPKEYMLSLSLATNSGDEEIDLKNVHAKGSFKVLKDAWDTSKCFTKEDWTEWIHHVSVTLLHESPSFALQSCTSLAHSHVQVSRELFNPSFFSCWEKLSKEFQDVVIRSIEAALTASTIPPEVLHMLLDLAEFMERSEKHFPIDMSKLSKLAEKCHALAKALYYREKELKLPTTRHRKEKTIESLFTLYDCLGHHDSANGLLLKNEEEFQIPVNLEWYEKLQEWLKTLEEYEKIQEKSPDNVKIMLGRMRCLKHLGRWQELSDLSIKCRSTIQSKLIHDEECADKNSIPEVSSFSLSAAFNLGNWEDLEKNVMQLDKHSSDGMFYRSVVAVHRNKHEVARDLIVKCRELAATELTALIGESYQRAYDVVVRIQQLSELEEIISYKSTTDIEKKTMFTKLWKRRLSAVERNVEVWQNILAVRSLVLPPHEDPVSWVHFAKLVRKNRRFHRASLILTSLMGVKHCNASSIDIVTSNAHPSVKYSYLNLLWHTNSHKLAFDKMEEWASSFTTADETVSRKQQARCYIKLAEWQLKLHDRNLNETVIPQMVRYCKNALENDGEWYRAWHTWAILNYRVLSYYTKQNENQPSSSNPKIKNYLMSALTGFIRAIALAPNENVQDTLRLLTLWFTHGTIREVETAIREGFDIINIDTWLAVIPQIIAHIHNPTRTVRNGIHQLLHNLGKNHPQALVFPITVALKSPYRQRVIAAQNLLHNMKQHNAKLVSEALLVADELIRTAILWKEKWFKGLEEASHLHYTEKNTEKMMRALQPLHEMLNKGPTTQHEIAFSKSFGRDLLTAWNCCKEYLETKKESCINLAWDLYAHVYRTIKKSLQSPEFDKIHLSSVSPALLEIKDIDLVVPGTYMKSYQSKKPPIKIRSFHPTFKVILSKQKPRKLIIHGNDGIDYPFLLKGHEDLRQDERAMQLFALVNTFLESDDITSKNHLSIQRYSVVPLSSETGLIEWLPHSDTIHELLNLYRGSHKISLEAELNFMEQWVTKNEYYSIPLMNKLEVFEYALEKTPGDDLERILWLNSKSSETWLEKRTNYTRSLAVMSMVGYILGLGDRHPNNLMLNRNSGKVIHIDFGDCFEVAMVRERFAEQVPFRLTRMLVNAMEIAGIRGTFKITCEDVMRVLRENKESIMAVLEAFVYDPLINWRLVRNPSDPSPARTDMANPLDQSSRPSKKVTRTELFKEEDSENDSGSPDNNSEFDNAELTSETKLKALRILERISDKLSGCEFPTRKGTLEVGTQVELLINQATSNEILCQAYLGWCPYW